MSLVISFVSEALMAACRRLAEWLSERGWSPRQLAEAACLDLRVVESLLAERYTSSPRQRERIAAALGTTTDSIRWGRPTEVENMYGHGPQFGRSP